MTTTVTVEWQDQFSGELGEEWDALASRARSDLPFHAARFISAAIAMAGNESAPRILLVRREVDGELVGGLMLGLAIERIGPFRRSVIRSLSFRRYDLTSSLIDPTAAAPVVEAMASALEARRIAGWQFDVRGVVDSDPVLSSLPGGWLIDKPSPLRVASLKPECSWESVIQNGHQRRELRRVFRALERDTAFTVRWAEGAMEAREYVDRFAVMHLAQQEGRRRTCAFASPAARAGLRELLADWVPAGAADIGIVVTAAGATLATYILLHKGRRTWAYRTTYDAEWKRYAPGAILLTAAIERAVARRSSSYDFGWGDEPYKSHWSEEAGHAVRLYASPPRFRQLGYRLLARLRRMQAAD